jgi:hypothetical protein
MGLSPEGNILMERMSNSYPLCLIDKLFQVKSRTLIGSCSRRAKQAVAQVDSLEMPLTAPGWWGYDVGTTI